MKKAIEEAKTHLIAWEAAYSSHYFIQISEDGKEWTSIAESSTPAGLSPYSPVEVFRFDELITTSHIPLLSVENDIQYPVSIYEIGLYNESMDYELTKLKTFTRGMTNKFTSWCHSQLVSESIDLYIM